MTAAALIVFWVALMGTICPAQFADSIEQYSWAHSLEWGYWKHPPLSTWIMHGAIALMGASHWTAQVLAGLCLVASVFFTWGVARMLMSERAAALAVLLWPLHHALSWRAQIYNHNTVLVLFSSALAWASLRAARSDRARDWMLAGLFAGLGLLAKYQAAVPIAGVLVAMGLTGVLRRPSARIHLALATGVACLVFAPHALWAMAHAFPTLSYVERSAPHLHWSARVPALLRFAGAQVTLLSSMLLVAVFVRFWPARGQQDAAHRASLDQEAEVRAWMIGLLVVPMVAVALAVTVAGLTPQRLWGLQTLQFLPLWLAWHIERARPDAALVRRATLGALAITAFGAAYAVHLAGDPQAIRRMRSLDRYMPAERLALAATQDWHRATACPLRLVTGDSFPAGLVSVYSHEYPLVLEGGDFEKSPWITPGQLREFGAIEVHGPVPPARVPIGAGSIEVPGRQTQGGVAAIYWRILPPATECAGPALKR